MDAETLWVLKKLSEREISAQFAERMLRGLKLLEKSEKSKSIPKSRGIGFADQKIKEPPEKIQKAVSYSTQSTAKPFAIEFVDEDESDAENYYPIDRQILERQRRQTTLEEPSPREYVRILFQDDNIEESDTSEQQNISKIEEVDQEASAKDRSETQSEEVVEILDKDNIDYPPEIIKMPPQDIEKPIEAAKSDSQDIEKASPKISRTPLLRDDGIGVIEDIIDDMELILEKAGDVIVKGWSQSHIRAVRTEIKEDLSNVTKRLGSLKIENASGVALYIPENVGKVNITSEIGFITVSNCPNDIVINSDTGNVNIDEASGCIEVSSIESTIVLENCCGEISLESDSGNITVRQASTEQNANIESLKKEDMEDILAVKSVKAKSDSGDVALVGIRGHMEANSSSGDIRLERCRSKSMNVGSRGGDIIINDIADDIYLENENGKILMKGFSGEVSIKSQDTGIFLKNSGDANIHIDSDSGDIDIADCYANVYIDLDDGNVSISGGDLSFGGMGRIELRMRSGNAYLHRKTFEDIQVFIEEGDAQLNMEKMSEGASGEISVYKGSVSVGVPPDFGCELDAHCARKDMHVELPIEIIEKDKSRLRGMLNGGGSKMKVIAPNGEIRFYAIKPSDEQDDMGNAVIDP